MKVRVGVRDRVRDRVRVRVRVTWTVKPYSTLCSSGVHRRSFQTPVGKSAGSLLAAGSADCEKFHPLQVEPG